MNEIHSDVLFEALKDLREVLKKHKMELSMSLSEILIVKIDGVEIDDKYFIRDVEFNAKNIKKIMRKKCFKKQRKLIAINKKGEESE